MKIGHKTKNGSKDWENKHRSHHEDTHGEVKGAFLNAAFFGAVLYAFVYFGVVAKALAGDHGEVAALHIVSLIADFISTTVVTSLVDFAAYGPWFERIDGFPKETPLAGVGET